MEVAKTLLIDGADPNARDEAGWVPLHIAALKGRTAIVAVLIEGGANLSARTMKGGKSPSDIAVSEGHLDIVDLLRA